MRTKMKTYKFGIVTDTNRRYNIYIAAKNGIDASMYLIDYLDCGDSMESMQFWVDNKSANEQMLFARFTNGSWQVCGICDIAKQFSETSIIYDGGEYDEDYGLELYRLEENSKTPDKWVIMDSMVEINDIRALNRYLRENDEKQVCIL